MDIKKIYRRFFYINTRSINSWQATTSISIHESLLMFLISLIIKKIFLPNLKISEPFVFIAFLVLFFVFNYFNNQTFKKKDKEYTTEWLQETKRSRMLYRISNVAFQIFLFSTCIFILMYLDNKF